MRTLYVILTLAALTTFYACDSTNSTAEDTSGQTTNETGASSDPRDSRPSQSIDTYLMRIDEAAGLTDAQRNSITNLLNEVNYESLSRAEQREIKKKLHNKIFQGILTAEQEQAWTDFLAQRRAKKEGGEN